MSRFWIALAERVGWSIRKNVLEVSWSPFIEKRWTDRALN
jgi:hypothetical protein